MLAVFLLFVFFLTCQTIEIYSNHVTSAASVHLSYVGLCAYLTHTHTQRKRSGHSQQDEAWTKSGIGLFPRGGLGVRAFLIRKTCISQIHQHFFLCLFTLVTLFTSNTELIWAGRQLY